VPTGRRASTTADLRALVDLTPRRASYVEGLSRGMQQRLGLARALVHDPAVLMLDEPASGLDPRARLELRAVVRELGQMGKAVLVSSHILAELADLCTHIAIVDGGRVLADGRVEEVTRRLHGGRAVRVQVLGEGERLRDLLLTRQDTHAVQLEATAHAGTAQPAPEAADADGSAAGDGMDSTGADGGVAGPGADGGDWGPGTGAAPGAGAATGMDGGMATLRFVLDGDEHALRALLADLIAAGFPIYGFGHDAGGLEDVFLQVTRRLGDAPT
jgi:ABC-2 type transport system ATP-binding protein